jgi:hypothetical protein
MDTLGKCSPLQNPSKFVEIARVRPYPGGCERWIPSQGKKCSPLQTPPNQADSREFAPYCGGLVLVLHDHY